MADPDPCAPLVDQATRLVDRLRTMSLDRLDAPWEGSTRRSAAIVVSQRLADTAARWEGPEPGRRQVPDVVAAAVGDLVAICAYDVVAAASRRPVDAEVRAVLEALAQDCLDLRRRL